MLPAKIVSLVALSSYILRRYLSERRTSYSSRWRECTLFTLIAWFLFHILFLRFRFLIATAYQHVLRLRCEDMPLISSAYRNDHYSIFIAIDYYTLGIFELMRISVVIFLCQERRRTMRCR